MSVTRPLRVNPHKLKGSFWKSFGKFVDVIKIPSDSSLDSMLLLPPAVDRSSVISCTWSLAL